VKSGVTESGVRKEEGKRRKEEEGRGRRKEEENS
jgi:hypothetical protein